MKSILFLFVLISNFYSSGQSAMKMGIAGIEVLEKACSTNDYFRLRVECHQRSWSWSKIELQSASRSNRTFQIALHDTKGSERFKAKVQASFSSALKDNEPNTVTIGLLEGNYWNDFLLLEDNLVPAGIESIELMIEALNQEMRVSVSTVQSMEVPIVIEYLDGSGIPMARQEYTAPAQFKLSSAFLRKAHSIAIRPSAGVEHDKRIQLEYDEIRRTAWMQVMAEDLPEIIMWSIEDRGGDVVLAGHLTHDNIMNINLEHLSDGVYVLVLSGVGLLHKEMVEIY